MRLSTEITPAQLARLRENPELTEGLLGEGEGEFSGETWPEDRMLDLDKSWHVIHFLLTNDPRGGPAPLKDTIVGGTEIGPDLGSGPARILTPVEVRAVAVALAGVREADLRVRFDPEALEASKIYPPLWRPQASPVRHGLFRRSVRAPDESTLSQDRTEFLDFAMANFRSLVPFYAAAARDGDAMLLMIG